MKWRRLLSALSFVPISIMLWFYAKDLSQQMRVWKMVQVQEERRATLQSTCSGEENLQISSSDLSKFIVDDNHGLIYCYVPKVACNHWKGVLRSLNQGESHPNPRSKSVGDAREESKFKTLDMYTKTEIQAKLRHYTKVFFARNPFARLISAFQNKFKEPNEYYYSKYGRHILQSYGNQIDPPHTAVEAFTLGYLISFNDFIQYLLDPKTQQPFNPHWRQINRLCHPCQIQYDFIGLQETLQDDVEQMLRLVSLEKDIQLPGVFEDMASSDSIVEWFSKVPLKDRRKLFQLYEEDFKLFGYRRPDELLDGDEAAPLKHNPNQTLTHSTVIAGQ